MSSFIKFAKSVFENTTCIFCTNTICNRQLRIFREKFKRLRERKFVILLDKNYRFMRRPAKQVHWN